MIRRAFLLLLLVPAAVRAAAPPLTLQHLEGIWAPDQALKTVLEKRSPHATLVETVKIHGDRLDWGNGHEATWRRIVRIETAKTGDTVLVTGPWEDANPQAADLQRVPFRVERDAAGFVKKLRFLDDTLVQTPREPWSQLEEPVETLINRRLLAGSYRDAQGRTWTFSPEGEATWPSESFSYQVSLDDSEADCDYIFFEKDGEVGGYRRYGFRWQGETLRIYEIAYPDDAAPIHCTKVLADLKRK